MRRVEARRLVLAQGEVETPAGALHVDCTALGLNNSPARPVFEADRITVQSVRHNSPTFSAALIGFVEAHRDEEVEKNRLCPPNPHASTVGDWPQMMSRSWRTEQIWPSEPDVMDWVLGSRLNLIGALPEHAGEEPVQAAVGNFVTHVTSAIERLGRMQ